MERDFIYIWKILNGRRPFIMGMPFWLVLLNKRCALHFTLENKAASCYKAYKRHIHIWEILTGRKAASFWPRQSLQRREIYLKDYNTRTARRRIYIQRLLSHDSYVRSWFTWHVSERASGTDTTAHTATLSANSVYVWLTDSLLLCPEILIPVGLEGRKSNPQENHHTGKSKGKVVPVLF
jgi:hypothetical protein